MRAFRNFEDLATAGTEQPQLRVFNGKTPETRTAKTPETRAVENAIDSTSGSNQPGRVQPVAPITPALKVAIEQFLSSYESPIGKKVRTLEGDMQAVKQDIAGMKTNINEILQIVRNLPPGQTPPPTSPQTSFPGFGL